MCLSQPANIHPFSTIRVAFVTGLRNSTLFRLSVPTRVSQPAKINMFPYMFKGYSSQPAKSGMLQLFVFSFCFSNSDNQHVFRQVFSFRHPACESNMFATVRFKCAPTCANTSLLNHLCNCVPNQRNHFSMFNISSLIRATPVDQRTISSQSPSDKAHCWSRNEACCQLCH